MTETRYCTNCGKPNTKGRFCSACGTSLAEPVPAMTAAAASNDEDAEGGAGPVTPAPVVQTPAPPPPPPPPGQAPGPGPYEQAGPSAPAARSWRPFAIAAGAVVLAGTLVAVLLLVLAGPSSDPAAQTTPKVTAKQAALATQNLYSSTQRREYYVLLPAGWVRSAVAKRPALQDGIAVKSAQDEAQTLTVGQLGRASGRLSAGAEGVERALTRGSEPTFSGSIGFPGGRRAYRINWTSGDRAGAAYLVDACERRYIAIGTAPTASFDALKERLVIVAASMQAQC